jgi:protein tyrosine/serine phosphatase
MTAHPGSGGRTCKRLALSVALLAVLVVAGYFGWLRLTDNFHTVVAGELYRSAQPSAADIARYKTAYGIRTIINLRGAGTRAPWYGAEIAESRRLGITHVDFQMSPHRLLSRADAEKMVDLLAHAERPILIHCKAGADRSSLVAALYMAAVAKRGESAAERQFSLLYGHLSLPFTASYAMDETWENLEPWLGFPAS